MNTQDKIKLLYDTIQNSKNVNVFTGAGISTLSGIPDFRGANGVYNKDFMGHKAEDILSIDFFYSNPEIFYKWCKDVWYNLDDYEPNIVHKVVKKFQDKGLIKNVFTQNIDMLHQRCGTKNVWELHGSAATNYCTKCHKTFKYDEVAKIIRSGAVPYCDKCKGLIKPNIILYGEGLDMNTLETAERVCSQSDLLLVLGSSLTVQPASILPSLTLRSGGKVVVINTGETYIDKYAFLRFNDLKEVFETLDKYL